MTALDFFNANQDGPQLGADVTLDVEFVDATRSLVLESRKLYVIRAVDTKTITLPAGSSGQRIILVNSAAGRSTIEGNFADATSTTLGAAGDSCTLVYSRDRGWVVLGQSRNITVTR